MSAERILLVEDDEVVRNGLRHKLEAEAYEVTPVPTVAEAMRALREGRPDLIVLDLTLLEDDPFGGLTDGFAFLVMLQRQFPDDSIPVIIHSVDDSPAMHARAQASGVYAVIQKGSPLSELLGTIRQALDEHRAPQAA